ncbi:hypothetical protein [Bradyrhizobium sp. WSM471]|uniref:hypothetical protein n=1 Tax=Bradyrhizobium sp. WSM471 TaxID=319017 RepID=UPI0002E6E939|nr:MULTISPECIES: hypothetical protein [Bradyrhizobium]UFW41631.1 hypothetical protein BcanWSM471_36500 [Bradyrhizobium canariense]
MIGVHSVAFSRCITAVLATHKMRAPVFVSIDSKLHLPLRLNPIILASKAGAGPVGVRQHKLPP